MAVPDYQSLMLPLLKLAGDGQEHSKREAIEALAEEFGLTREDREELLPSGRQSTFDNRVGWARTYLKKARLLTYPKRGYFKITERGLNVLEQKPSKINNRFLRQFPEFVEFQTPKKVVEPDDGDADELDKTPEEEIESAYQQIRESLAVELLEAVKSCTPVFFEQLVVDLLLKMGYGGTRKDAGEAIGRSGDEGIDGIIKEDRLGLDIVYIQAKKWDANSVSRPEVQKFAGALQGKRARKGIFITTSEFTAGAREYVSRIDSKIVLIDGNELAQLMIDNDIGVNVVTSYNLKRIDSDYFEDE